MFSNPSKCDGYKPDDITYELRLRCETHNNRRAGGSEFVFVTRSPCRFLTGNRFVTDVSLHQMRFSIIASSSKLHFLIKLTQAQWVASQQG